MPGGVSGEAWLGESRRRRAKLAAPKPSPTRRRRRPKAFSPCGVSGEGVFSSLTRGDVTGQKPAGGGAAVFDSFEESTVGV